MFGADGTLEPRRERGLGTWINRWQTESGRSGHRRVIVSSSSDWREREGGNALLWGMVLTHGGRQGTKSLFANKFTTSYSTASQNLNLTLPLSQSYPFLPFR